MKLVDDWKTLYGFTREYLSECFEYDPLTGYLRWKERPLSHYPSEKLWKIQNKKFAGKLVNYTSVFGYLRASIKGQHMMAHRICWFLHTGEFPECIDHINGVKTDNRVCNLRNVDYAENNKNQPRKINNKTGETGIHLSTKEKKYVLQIGHQRIGAFATMAEAITAKKVAYQSRGYHENHGRKNETN